MKNFINRLKKSKLNKDISLSTFGSLVMALVLLLGPNYNYAQVPVNDDICNATEIILDTIHSSTNTNATTQASEVSGSCFGDGSLDATVWFYFVVPFSGQYQTSTDFSGGTNNDTQLAAYNSSGGCTGNLSEIGCDEDGGILEDWNSIMQYNSVAGDTVWIQLDGWNGPPVVTGTFNIQTTLIKLADSFDVNIANANIEASGIAGYALVPSSQYENGNVHFTLDVKNSGLDSISDINILGSIDPGQDQVSVVHSALASFETKYLTTSTFAAMPNTAYTVDFSASVTENEADTSNNSRSFSFASGMVSDSVFARENQNGSTFGSGFPTGSGKMANSFEFTNPDTITSITIHFVQDPIGKDFELFVVDYSDRIGSNEIWNSGTINSNSGFNSFFTYSTGDLPLNPGTYLVGIRQIQPSVLIGLGTIANINRPNSSFFGEF